MIFIFISFILDLRIETFMTIGGIGKILKWHICIGREKGDKSGEIAIVKFIYSFFFLDMTSDKIDTY